MNIKFTENGKLDARATVDEIKAGKMVYAEHVECLIRQAFTAGVSRGWHAAKTESAE